MFGSEAMMSSGVETREGLDDNAAAHLNAILASSEDGIITLDADGLVTTWNEGAQRLLGFNATEMLGSDLSRVIPEDRLEEHMEIARRLDEKRSTLTLDTLCLHKEGSLVDVSLSAIPISDGAGRRTGATLIFRDITYRKSMEDEAARRSFEDPVTGLSNRYLLRQRVEHAVNRKGRKDFPFALLLIDLDDFKTINDGFDNAVAGDGLLALVGQRLSACVRPTDTVARLGGDEFGILLEEMDDLQDATCVGERILDLLMTPLEIDGSPVVIHASIGISTSNPMADATAMFRDADTAMNTSKARGGASVSTFEPGMHLGAVKRLSLKKDLFRAVEEGAFFLEYQPMVDLDTGVVSGVEALVRWEHATRGVVPPMEFIPLAQETGLMVPIGYLVLEQACREAASWNGSFAKQGLRISVNLSAQQLLDPSFIRHASEILDGSALDPAHLIFEITESMFLDDIDEMARVLHALRETGASVAIDDFGTGYSSLSYLDKLPINILKIDRAFIRGLSRGPESAGFVKALIRLGQALELQTVAEGIELSEQVVRLRALHCNLGQGFYFAKPLDPATLKQILEAETFGFERLEQWQPQAIPRVISLAS
jgi:diguanylate cyclase (GGDEF)-like protein/PAS domain S-box-containing protein